MGRLVRPPRSCGGVSTSARSGRAGTRAARPGREGERVIEKEAVANDRQRADRQRLWAVRCDRHRHPKNKVIPLLTTMGEEPWARVIVWTWTAFVALLLFGCLRTPRQAAPLATHGTEDATTSHHSLPGAVDNAPSGVVPHRETPSEGLVMRWSQLPLCRRVFAGDAGNEFQRGVRPL